MHLTLAVNSAFMVSTDLTKSTWREPPNSPGLSAGVIRLGAHHHSAL